MDKSLEGATRETDVAEVQAQTARFGGNDSLHRVAGRQKRALSRCNVATCV